MLPCYAFLPGSGTTIAVPVVSAISKTLGLTGGRQKVTITVNSSTGCTAAAIGGVSLTSFAIVDSTHVSGVTGAKAASTGNTVTVTNAGGASAPALSYEYWAPLATGLQVWYDVNVSTVVSNKLTALPDQSGNARNATISGTGLVVTAANSGYSNIPTVNIVTATDSIRTPTTTGITTGARTLVFVGDAPGAPAYTFLMRSGDALVDLRAQSGSYGATDDGGATVLTSGAATTTSPAVVIGVYNGSTSRIYGKAATAQSGNAGTLSDLTGIAMYVGDAGAGGGGGDQNVAHALVYSGALTDAQCKELLRGFGALTGITIGS